MFVIGFFSALTGALHLPYQLRWYWSSKLLQDAGKHSALHLQAFPLKEHKRKVQKKHFLSSFSIRLPNNLNGGKARLHSNR